METHLFISADWIKVARLWRATTPIRARSLRGSNIGCARKNEKELFFFTRLYDVSGVTRKVLSNSKHTLLCLCGHKRTIKLNLVSCVTPSLVCYRNNANVISICCYEILLTYRFTDSLSYSCIDLMPYSNR